MHILLTIISILSFVHKTVDYSSIEEYITRCAERKKTIVLDRDIQINKDVVIYRIKGQGHTINISEGVTIKTTDESLFLNDITFVINEYGNKYGFTNNRGRLIQSKARKVYLKDIIVKTAKEGDELIYDETTGRRA